jgi:hypothetical protein
MMSRLVPKLRFKEFGGEWKEKKLSMVSNITTGTFLFCASMRESRDERQEAIFCCSVRIGSKTGIC